MLQTDLATAVVVYEICSGTLRYKPAIAGSENATIAKRMRFEVTITIAVYAFSNLHERS